MHTYLKRGVCMIVDEYKSGATIIKFDDEYISTKEESILFLKAEAKKENDKLLSIFNFLEE